MGTYSTPLDVPAFATGSKDEAASKLAIVLRLNIAIFGLFSAFVQSKTFNDSVVELLISRAKDFLLQLSVPHTSATRLRNQ